MDPERPEPERSEEAASAAGPGIWTDKKFLVSNQYADSTNLSARQAIYDFQEPRRELARWALSHLHLRGDETIADVGCGNGPYLSVLNEQHGGPIIGLDLSFGMLQDARKRLLAQPGAGSRVLTTRADAQQLPLAKGSCDIALAMHMLYHVPDPPAALRELRRVVRDGGRVALVLNADDHLKELRDLLDSLLRRLGSRATFPLLGKIRLPEGATLLSEIFTHVEQHPADAELRITDPEPVVQYALSMGVALSDAVDTKRLANEIRAAVRRHLEADGVFVVKTAPGLLVAS